MNTEDSYNDPDSILSFAQAEYDRDPMSEEHALRFGVAIAKHAPGIDPMKARNLLLTYGRIQWSDDVCINPADNETGVEGDFARYIVETNTVRIYDGSEFYIAREGE